MKNKFHRHVSTKRIQIEKFNPRLSTQFIDQIARLSIKRNSLLSFSLQNLTEQQCQVFHQFAILHREANRVDQYDLLNKKKKDQIYRTQQEDKCECCKIVKGNKLSIFTSYEKFLSLGMGVLLFFYFFQIIIVLSCLYFIIFAIPTLIINSKGSMDAQNQTYSSNFYTIDIYKQFSIERTKFGDNMLFLQSIIGFLWCVIFIIIERVCNNIGSQKEKKFDQQIFTPSDITIKIQNLPTKNYTKQQLTKFLEQIMGRPDFKITKMFIAYQITQFYQIMNKMENKSVEILNLKKEIDEEKNLNIKKAKNQELVQMYYKLEEHLNLLRAKINKFMTDQQFRRSLATSCCLIRVNNQDMKNQFLLKYQTDMIGSLERYVHDITASCGISQERQYLKFKGNQLEIMRAPQPIDIIWENCRYQKTSHTKVGIWVISIIIICADFTVMLMLLFLQYTIQKYNANRNSFQMIIIQISMSLATILLNNILYFAITVMIVLQNNHTKTEQILSKTQKLIISQCLNTILLPIIAMAIIVENHDIIPSVSSLVLSYSIVNAIVQNLLTVFSKDYVLKGIVLNIKCIRNLIIRYYAASQIQCNRFFLEKLNQFYQNQDLNKSNAYSYYVSTFLHMSFFGFEEPIIILFGLAGIAINCGIKRLLFILRYRKPVMVQSLLFHQMMKFLAVAPILFGLGGLYCLSSFKIDSQISSSFTIYYKPKIIFLVCVVVGFINVLKFKVIQKRIDVIEILSHRLSLGSFQHDTGQSFDYYDDYHVHYNLKNVIGYIEHLSQQKPTDDTLERINKIIEVEQKIQSNYSLKRFQNMPTKKIKTATIPTQKFLAIPPQSQSYGQMLIKPIKQRQLVNQDQNINIKSTIIRIVPRNDQIGINRIKEQSNDIQEIQTERCLT